MRMLSHHEMKQTTPLNTSGSICKTAQTNLTSRTCDREIHNESVLGFLLATAGLSAKDDDDDS